MLAKIKRFVGGRVRQARAKRELAEVLKSVDPTSPPDLSKHKWQDSLREPTAFYLDAVRNFHSNQLHFVREHRHYFQQERRGFGEDAFHVMWWLIFTEYRPAEFLEIGVYRGQTLSLAALLQSQLSIPGHVVGISPFTPAGDEVSKYREDVNYLEDTLSHFAHFNLPRPELLKAYSTDSVAVKRIAATQWDCIYIDGNHDYDVVVKDWRECASALKPGGIIVLDDSALNTSYRPPAFATAGHPGPSRLASEIDPATFSEILRVGHNRVFRKLSK